MDRAFQLVAAFIEPSTRYERTATLRKVHTRYNEILCDLTGGERRQSWNEKELEMMDEIGNSFKQMPLDTFDAH